MLLLLMVLKHVVYIYNKKLNINKRAKYLGCAAELGLVTTAPWKCTNHFVYAALFMTQKLNDQPSPYNYCLAC